MFDTIIVDTGLPDGASNQVAFETRDFGAALRKFRITPQGNLKLQDTEWRAFDHQGLVTFHDGERVYTAKFVHGLLVGIRTGDSDVWINVDDGVDPWEVLENVHTALKNLEYDWNTIPSQRTISGDTSPELSRDTWKPASDPTRRTRAEN
jgi:hypothetical protein